MKITAIETVQLPHLNNILWVQVHTDEGIIGLGETFRGANAVAAYIHSDIAPQLVGQNPLEIERISKLLLEPYVGFRSSGVEIRAASDDYPLWKQQLLTDPQTSGGLLLSCAAGEAERLLNSIHAAGYPSASIIGKVTEGAARVTVTG